MTQTANLEAKPKRGDLAVVGYKTYATNTACRLAGLTIPYATPSGLHYVTHYAIGRVTSVTREGHIKAVRVECGTSLGTAGMPREYGLKGGRLAETYWIQPNQLNGRRNRLEALLPRMPNEFLTLDGVKRFVLSVVTKTSQETSTCAKAA